MSLDLSKYSVLEIYKALKKRSNKNFLSKSDREYIENTLNRINSQWMCDGMSEYEAMEQVSYSTISFNHYHDEELIEEIESGYDWLMEEDDRIKNIVLNFAIEKHVLATED